MGRNFRKNDRLRAMSDINVTPMLDLAFALLIIFMISTPLLENQTIPIDLPMESSSRQPSQDEPRRTVSVDKDGNFYWGDERVTIEGLDERFRSLASQANPPIISVRGDAQGPYQNVVTIIDLMKKYNLTKISLDTRRASK